YAQFEAAQGDFGRFKELNGEAIALAREDGDYASAIVYEYNQAWVLRLMGHPEAAQKHMLLSIPKVLRINMPGVLVVVAEEYAVVLADLGDHPAAVRLLGAADAMRQRQATPRLPTQQAEIAEQVAKTHAALNDQDWEAAYQAGRNTTVEDALRQAHAATSG
ncbi:MAG TPA: hypothetical protein VGP44_06445, partial [Gemmatimonadales bacterium]|nr:hypothetical protein [Gemmatimonadales bacterium]